MTRFTSFEIYERMVLIRRFEEEVGRRFRRGELPGFVHLSIGQEASAVGICSVLRRDDYIATTHRGHGHVVAKGAELRKLAAELYGSEEGACKGVGGSMHLVDLDQGVLCAGAIVGGTIPLATGAAFAFARQDTQQVAVSFFGDGATAQGVFHECLNIASLWKLPIVYVCENNGYAEMTPLKSHTALASLTDHGTVYGIPSVSVDGNDAQEVQAAAAEAVERARRGDGPSLLECRTYRYCGHYEGDPQNYKSQEEQETWKQRDPLRILGDRLVESGEATREDLDAAAERATAMVHEAFDDMTGTTITLRDLEVLTYAEPL